MTDILNNLAENENDGLNSELEELEQFQAAVPQSAYITIRHEAARPVFIALNEGETSITIAEALNRRAITVSPNIQAYVEGTVVPLTATVAAGAVVTLVGNVKGG